MPQPGRVMIDIETLGTKPGCSIVSVGAVAFDLGGPYDEFYMEVSAESCQEAGLTIDAETLLWWLKQGTEARRPLRYGMSLERVLSDLEVFLHVAPKGESEKVEIWANAPTFDCSILRAAYETVGMETPWSFRNERCYRTLKNLPGADGVVSSIDREGQHHNALDDAIYQANVAASILGAIDR